MILMAIAGGAVVSSMIVGDCKRKWRTASTRRVMQRLLRWLLVLVLDLLLLWLLLWLLSRLLLLLPKQNRRSDERVRGRARGRKRNGRRRAIFVRQSGRRGVVRRIGRVDGNHNLALDGQRRRQLFRYRAKYRCEGAIHDKQRHGDTVEYIKQAKGPTRFLRRRKNDSNEYVKARYE